MVQAINAADEAVPDAANWYVFGWMAEDGRQPCSVRPRLRARLVPGESTGASRQDPTQPAWVSPSPSETVSCWSVSVRSGVSSGVSSTMR